jgi:hypothetical protein
MKFNYESLTSTSHLSANKTQTSPSSSSNQSSVQDVFQIAAKAEQLLKEILSANKSNSNNMSKPTISIKQEPTEVVATNNVQNVFGQTQSPSTYSPYLGSRPPEYGQMVQAGHVPPGGYMIPPQPAYVDPSYFVKNPPPPVIRPQGLGNSKGQMYYLSSTTTPIGVIPHILPPGHHPHALNIPSSYHQGAVYPTLVQQYPQPGVPYHHLHSNPHANILNHQTNPPHHHPYFNYKSNASNGGPSNFMYRKRRFGELSTNGNNRFSNARFSSMSSASSIGSLSSSASSSSSSSTTSASSPSSTSAAQLLSQDKSTGEFVNTLENEEQDLNIMRERELKELKCKSVVEKMSVFLRYYQQFKEAYIQRVQTIECSDSLKLQFHSLIKYLNEYEMLLAELDMMITEHERISCKNNHRKTKKFFNKTKAFIRYECNKRLQANIFEYRRLINSQDRYAGMYDLLDMNGYLISLLPDIGVSIRRYINKCEKAKQEEQEEQEEDDEYAAWHSENSDNESTDNQTSGSFKNTSWHLDKENDDENDDETNSNLENSLSNQENGENVSVSNLSEKKEHSSASTFALFRNHESFSKSIDTLNRYLLKRVEEEESLDELVKERIIKWINKRQAKYILIFSDVDKLLNQHKAGECYAKFHSFLLFNLGKLVTVCDSYHQKLKELLYSTTIRRKKKRKKVKLLPEAMSDVFNQINDLKKSLEYTKLQVKKCNQWRINSSSNNNLANLATTSSSSFSLSPSSSSSTTNPTQ